jgi:hypothetical protein
VEALIGYPIRHFEYMAKFAAELKDIPAQVLEHECRFVGRTSCGVSVPVQILMLTARSHPF